ncbi:hypothetical protein [Clostridium tertium]|uniref:hypothetical protein n=1 Tax=Clostridium tertium TaxID=1559 RepID=UPI0035625E5C
MENIEELIKETVAITIKELNKKQNENNRRKILYNTRLLLKNYNELKNHAINAIYKNIEWEEIDKLNGEEANYSDDEILIESIKKSKARTLIMIAHIDVALERVKQKHRIKGTIEKYKALELYYIKESSKEDIAAELNCSVKSTARWIKEVEDEVGTNLFGINSIEHILI